MLVGDGTTVPIEQVEIGDEVWTTEGETGESSPQPVTDLIVGTGVKHLVDVVAGGQTIVATAGHPFWTAEGGWTNAGDLQAGDRLRHPDRSTTVIEQVRHRADPDTTVHNLTVDTTHTYYIGHDGGDTTLLVHNASRCGSSATGRSGRQARLRELADDPKQPSHVRGWIKNELRQRGPGRVRNPKGYELAHRRGHEAVRGCDYRCSELQMRAQHRVQSAVDKARGWYSRVRRKR